MKILQLISGDLWAGAENQVYNLAIELTSKVELAVVVFNSGELFKRLNEAGVKTYLVEENSNSFFEILKQVNSIIEDFQPEIIHTHRYKENLIGLLCVKKRNIKLVATLHGLVELKSKAASLKMAIYQKINQFILKRYFNSLICVSKDVSLNFSSQKNIVIHNGINPASFKVVRAQNTTEKGILFLGRLVKVKQIDHLFRILKDLNQQYTLHIVGAGPLEKDLKELAKPFGTRIRFYGEIKDPIKLLELLANNTFIAFTSLHEGIPIALLEGMAAGLVPICYPVGGIKEVVTEECGVLNQNILEIVKILNLITKETIETKRKYCTNRIISDFSIQKNASATILLYQNLIKAA